VITYGRGHAVVTGTGMDTEMGAIADALTNAKEEETPLQIKLNELSRKLSAMILVICAFVFVVNLVRNGGKAVLDTFMIAVSLAVAAIPEGLSAVVTVLLSIGVTRMSKNHAIMRKLTAVETLGCTRIICSDKTGTLTQNKMTVVRKVTGDEKLLMTAMALCSDAELEQGEAVGEATECALVNDANKNGMPKPDLAADLPRVDEAPFDSLRKMMTTLHRASAGDGFIQFTKGAPDEVLRRCSRIWQKGQAVPMTEAQRKQILEENKAMQLELYRKAAQKHYSSTIAGVAYYLFPLMTMFTSDFPESNHIRRIKVKTEDASRNLYEEVQNSYKYRREELDHGFIEDGEMEEIAELEYAKAGITTPLYPLDVAYSTKGLKSCPYVKVDKPPFAKKKAKWNTSKGDPKEIKTTHPILKGRLV
jgi:hypothetical protein